KEQKQLRADWDDLAKKEGKEDQKTSPRKGTETKTGKTEVEKKVTEVKKQQDKNSLGKKGDQKKTKHTGKKQDKEKEMVAGNRKKEIELGPSDTEKQVIELKQNLQAKEQENQRRPASNSSFKNK